MLTVPFSTISFTRLEPLANLTGLSFSSCQPSSLMAMLLNVSDLLSLTNSLNAAGR